MANVTQEYILKVAAQGLKEVVREVKGLRSDLAGVSKSTDAAAAGMQKVGKGAGEADRNIKGAANATNNGTKAFSKMAQGMQGTLVPAYATVAANVFALTAAFGALERAADTQILIKASEELAKQTGRSLTQLAGNMKEITGNAISMKEALTSASIAASAGFDNSTIESLTQVARNASVALGRDMTDSLNRVFKGAIKAEPELLDELGIILRLDPATRKYAASIGKAAKDLTTFEKQQAIVNEVLAQGQEKFGLLSEVDPNPYTQLASSFADITNTALGFLNLGIGPVISALTDNVGLLTGALIVFGSSVAKSALPILQQMGVLLSEDLAAGISKLADDVETQEIASVIFEGFEDNLKDVPTLFDDVSDQVKTSLADLGDDLPTGFADSIRKDLTLLGKDSDRIANVIDSVNKELEELDNTVEKNTPAYTRRQLALKEVRAAAETYSLGLKKLQADQTRLGTSIQWVTLQYETFSKTLKFAKFGATKGFIAGTEEGFSKLGKNIRDFRTSLDSVDSKGRLASNTIKNISTGVYALSGAFGSLIKSIPIIGQVIFALSLLREGVSFIFNLFRDEKAIENFNDAVSDSESAIKTSSKAADSYNKTLKDLPDTIDNITSKTTLLRNTFTELSDSLQILIESTPDQFSALSDLADFVGLGILDEFKDQLEDQAEAVKKLGAQEEINNLIAEYGPIARLSGEESKAFAKELLALEKQQKSNADATFEANEILKSTFVDLGKGLDTVAGSLPKLTNTQEVLVQLNNIITNIDTYNIDQLASAFENLTDAQATQIGVSTEITQLTTLSTQYKTLTKDVDELNKALTEEVGFGILNSNDVLELELKNQIAGKEKDIATIKAQQERITDSIVEKLEVYKGILDTIEKAERNITRVRERSAFELSKSEISTARRLELLKQLAQEEKNYTGIITGQLNTQLKSLKAEETRAKNIQSAVSGQRKLVIPEDTPMNNLLGAFSDDVTVEEAEKKLKQYKETAVDNAKDIRETESKSFQIQTQLRELRGNSAKEYIKFLSATRKELLLTAKAQALGITVVDDYISKLRDDYKDALGEVAANLETVKDGDSFIDKQLEGLDKALITAKELALIDFAGFEATINAALGAEQAIVGLERRSALLQETNKLLDERADKLEIVKVKELEVTLAALQGQIGKTEDEGALERNIAAVERQIDATKRLGDAKRESKAEDILISLQKENTARLNNIKILKLTGKAREDEIIRQAREAANKLKQPFDEIEKELRKRFATKFAEDFNKEIRDATDAVTPLSNAITEMTKAFDNENIDNFAASMLTLSEIGEQTGNSIATGLGNFGLVLKDTIPETDDFIESFKELDASQQFRIAEAALSGMAGAMNEGSTAAKILNGITSVLATTAAALAIVKQAEGEPYSAFARMAAMASIVASVLSAAGIAFSGGSSSGGGSSAAADKYQASVGSQGLVGRDLQTNSLVDSVDQLTSVNTRLFSSERSLQISIKKLGESFDKVAGALFNFAGSFGATDLKGLFNFVAGEDLSTGFFGDTTTSTSLIGAGIELGATIEFLGDELGGSIDRAKAFLIKQITETSSGFLGIGGGTDIDIKTKFKNLPEDVAFQLGLALEETANVVTGLFEQLADNVKISLEDLFAQAESVSVTRLKIDLADKSAEEQSDAIAAFFSNLSNKVIKQVVPGLREFSRAGEELTDTLIRIVTEIQQLNNSFSTIGTSIEQFSFGTSNLDDAFEEYLIAFDTSVAAGIDTITDNITQLKSFKNFTSEAQKLDFVAQIEEMFGVTLAETDFTRDRRFITTINNFISQLNSDLTTLNNKTASTLQQFSIEATAIWNEALLGNFADINEFETLFEKFAKAIYSETELAEIALENSEKVLADGLSELTNQLSVLEKEDLLSVFDAGITKETLRNFYDLATASELFTTGVNEATGELEASGAEILATIIQMGAAFLDVEEAIEDTNTALADFERDLRRQLEAFGLLGKELALLELTFEFEDTLERARELGADLALVEELYALKRLDIIRSYNQQIVDSLDSASQSLSESIIDVISSFGGWDEVIHQALIVNKLTTNLAKGLEKTGIAIDFSAFDDILDLEGVDEFVESFGDYLNITEKVPENIEDQIAMVEDLQSAIMARYNAEEDAVNNLLDLAVNIGEYLDDLILSDLSPATTAEKLAEAQAQFSRNIADLGSDDPEARSTAANALLGSADTLLELGSQFWAASDQYQDLFRFVTEALSNVEQDISDPISNDAVAITDLQKDTLAQLGVLDNILDELYTSNEQSLTSEIVALSESLSPYLENIVTKLNSINDDTWEPIKNILLAIAGNTVDLTSMVTTDIVPSVNITAAANDSPYDITESTAPVITALDTSDKVERTINDLTTGSVVDTLRSINDYTLVPMKNYLASLVVSEIGIQPIDIGPSLVYGDPSINNDLIELMYKNILENRSNEETDDTNEQQIITLLGNIMEILAASQEDILEQAEIIADNTTPVSASISASTEGIV